MFYFNFAKSCLSVVQLRLSYIFILCFLLIMSCGGDSDSQSEPNQQPNSKIYNRSDLKGTWILKGNSSTMAVVSFDNQATTWTTSDGKSTYYNGGTYNLVEYIIDGNNFVFNGYFRGGYDFNGSKLSLDTPTYYNPTKNVNDGITSNIPKQSFFCNELTIDNLNDSELKISLGEVFFIGTRNTEYTSSYVSENVGKNDFVDLGLSVNWAKCNIGASKAEEFGYYVGWADPNGDKTSKNNDDYPTSTNIPTTICGTEYDIATKKWGDKWRLPTFKELQELAYGCIQEKVSFNGIAGTKYTGITGKSIFLPRSGKRIGTEITGQGYDHFYWSGEKFSWNNNCAWGDFSGSLGGWYAERYTGCSVRAVCNK